LGDLDAALVETRRCGGRAAWSVRVRVHGSHPGRFAARMDYENLVPDDQTNLDDGEQ
jgi:hypothetical protein